MYRPSVHNCCGVVLSSTPINTEGKFKLIHPEVSIYFLNFDFPEYCFEIS